jgi:hypothetical protein
MIQRCAKQDTKKKLSPKDALDIVKGVYKGMKDLSFFSMYPRTLDQRPATVNFRTHLDDITPSNFGEEEKGCSDRTPGKLTRSDISRWKLRSMTRAW